MAIYLGQHKMWHGYGAVMVVNDGKMSLGEMGTVAGIDGRSDHLGNVKILRTPENGKPPAWFGEGRQRKLGAVSHIEAMYCW